MRAKAHSDAREEFMKTAPSALVIDDGELTPLFELLWQLQVDVSRPSEARLSERVSSECDLIFSTVARALKLDSRDANALTSGRQAPTWLALLEPGEAPSEQTNRRLRDLGVNYAVQPGVEGSVLRMLVRDTLFDRQNHREAARTVVGASIFTECRGTRRQSVLGEIAPGGCRLLHGLPDTSPGDEIALEIPPSVTGGALLRLAGEIVRNDQETGPIRRYGATKVFLETMLAWSFLRESP